MLPVATAAEPIPEANARKASEVAPTETKSRYAEGDRRADVKEATVLQVASLPTSTTEGAPGPTKDVTVGDEGAMNGTSVTLVSDPLPPPAQRTIVSRPVDTARAKQWSITEGEGFASDVTWEERTWSVRL